MSDEEVVRTALDRAWDTEDPGQQERLEVSQALSRILSDRDSLRTENKWLREGDLGEAREFGDRWRQKANELGVDRDSLRAALHKARFVLRTSDFTRSLDALVVIDAALDKEKG